MSSLRINSTTNYRLFTRSSENRDTNIGRRKRLKRSMQKYGNLPYFPIVCKREGGKLVVLEGQHRLAMAESLGLPVHWVEAVTEFDIAEINGTAETWKLKDYAEKFSNNGVAAYTEGLEFARRHKMAIGVAFALLGGTASFSAVEAAFIAGTYRVRDRKYAEDVASLYGPLVSLSVDLKGSRCLQACMMLCRVKEFDASRLLHNAGRCREKLVSYSTRDAYLTMFEEVYNFGRAKLFGLKTAAVAVMRRRNAATAAVERKAAKAAALQK